MGRVGRPRGWRGSALKSGVRTPGRVTASSIGSIDTILSQSRPPAVSQQHQYSPLLRSQTTLQPGVKAHATSVLGTASACSYANTIATAEHRAMHQYDAYGEAFLMAVTSIRLGVLESAMPSICCSRRGTAPGNRAVAQASGCAGLAPTDRYSYARRCGENSVPPQQPQMIGSVLDHSRSALISQLTNARHFPKWKELD